MNRRDKIKLLKEIQAGKVTAGQMQEPKFLVLTETAAGYHDEGGNFYTDEQLKEMQASAEKAGTVCFIEIRSYQGARLHNVSGVITANPVTAQRLRVKYDSRKITVEGIIKVTGGTKSIEQ